MQATHLFPLPFNFHVVFGAISVIFFVIQFVRKRYDYYILLILAVLSTFLSYFCESDASRIILAAEELALFVLIFISQSKTKKKLAEIELAQQVLDEDKKSGDDAILCETSEVEKPTKEETSNEDSDA